MLKPYPREFRDDVVRSRQGDAPLTQIAVDFGVSEATVHNWLKRADVEDGIRPGVTTLESAELRKHNRLLEQENEVLRRSGGASVAGQPQAGVGVPKIVFPLVHELAAAGARIRVPVAVICRVLDFSKQAYYQWCSNPVSQRDWDEAHLVNAALRCMPMILVSGIGSSPTSWPNTRPSP